MLKVLFKCDIWKMRNSMVFLGVFDDDVLIEECINKNDLRDDDNEYFYIQNVEINEEV